MANTSIGGLVSGLDTASIISQLIQLEARPQTMLKTRLSTEQRSITSLQTLNAKLAAIATKAGELAKASAWSPTTATSSSDKVTVSTSTGATAGSLTLTVTQVATPYRVDYGPHALTEQVVTNGDTQVKLTVGGTTVPLETGDGTLKGLVDAVNAQNRGVTASLVRRTDGTYRVSLATTATGAAASFSLTDSSGGALTLAASPGVTTTPGVPATITVGPDTIESDSNTFTGLMPGVDVTVGAGSVGATATVAVSQDVTGMTDRVKAMVDAVNLALDDVASLTAYNGTAKTAGPLAGDATLRDVRNTLLSAVTGGVGGASLAPYGIQTDRSGKLVFDAEKFKAAYTADPSGTATKFTAATVGAEGFATRLEALTKAMSNGVDGSVTNAIKGRSSAVDRMEDDIADWDVRLAQRRAGLERQYSALEVALGKLQSQSQWLAGQIGSLPKMSNG